MAVVALVAPWIWAAYKRWKYTPTVEIVLSPKVSCGYTRWGAIVSVEATMQALHGDAFIISAEVALTNTANNRTETLQWRYITHTTVNYLGQYKLERMSPKGFVVKDRSGYSLDAYYAQRGFEPRIAEIADAHESRWRTATVGSQLPDDDETTAAGVYQPSTLTMFIEQFQRESKDHEELESLMQQNFSWHVGEYVLTLRLRTADNRSFECKGSFSLSDDDRNSLYANCKRIVWTVYRPSESFYRWVERPLKSKHHE